MEITKSRARLSADAATQQLVDAIEGNQAALGLVDATAYTDFPLYKDDEGAVLTCQLMVVSPMHGVVVLCASAATSHSAPSVLKRADDELAQVTGYVNSKLVRSKTLRKSLQELSFPLRAVLFAPFLEGRPAPATLEAEPVLSAAQLTTFFQRHRLETPIGPSQVSEIRSILEGAKGLIKPKKRDLDELPATSLGAQAAAIEQAISTFDAQQKAAYIQTIESAQRIRGLAGSGKTVILTLKAAITHLRDPNALILYTFHTKSLYQHVRRLITRFYRQFDDQDPDWSRIHVLHAWGGKTEPGVYFNACEDHGVAPMRFQDAARASTPGQEFGYAVQKLLDSVSVTPKYDCVFADEGQDFPVSFLRLVKSLAKDQRFVLAEDELQNIFQSEPHNAAQIFGTDDAGQPKGSFEPDLVLRKCYRNPREVLVCAHALGFGLYGDKIVQMLENKDHWKDIGYDPKTELVEGAVVRIERPKENSLDTLSSYSSFDDVVRVEVVDSLTNECEWVAARIEEAVRDGLRPDDVLVIAVDDRNARQYLSQIADTLAARGIASNNTHATAFSQSFSVDGQVTLATVHKAKGNEAFMVFVVGVDALFAQPTVRKRNMLFTAMTRAKGWVRLSGIGASAEKCLNEVAEAKKNFPALVFSYPSAEQLKVMRRDLEVGKANRLQLSKQLQDAAAEMNEDDLEALLQTVQARRDERRKAKK